MGVYIGAVDDYSAMQGPAPDGFHVPLNTEWQAVRDVRVALGGGSSDGTNFGIALKLPFAGFRSGSSASVFNQGSRGYYWSSSRNSTNYAYYLDFNSTALYPQSYYERASGYSLRCFKDTPTIPTSSWTKLYGTSIEAGGIFWSSADGLISLSSDGQTRITIQDKNLGATTVWNSGDTLSEANAGKYYQRGNNYGFAWTGSVTTSSTQVNASTYGPGNYYSSSTFITRSSTPFRWDTTDNGNLWGGETGTVKIGQELKNAYIGEYVPPYLCFTANTTNSTVQLTQTGSPTSVTLETSTDGSNWSTYTIGSTITLSNIGDKVYWRNTSETDTGFSTGTSDYYKFVMSGSILGSGDINYLINKNSTNIVGDYGYRLLFQNCTSLITPPNLPATSVGYYSYANMFQNTGITTVPKLQATSISEYAYMSMFYGCTQLEAVPKLDIVSIPDNAYRSMFQGCSKIKLSTTQTGEYQTAYRMPTTGTGTAGASTFFNMFSSTGGTFTGTPSINTTYYTSNTVV